MARKSKDDGGGTATLEPGEQHDLFPELDPDNDDHKALLRAARKFNKEKAARAALLTTSKEKVDALGEKVIAAMHAAKLTKFRYDGVTAEIISGHEKIEVKIEDKKDDDSGDDE